MPQPLPDTIAAGVPLSERDAQEIRIAIQSRDGLIRMYQKLLVEKEQRLRDFLGAAQKARGGVDTPGYDVILGSRSWRMIMKLHRLRYRLRETLRTLRLGGR